MFGSSITSPSENRQVLEVQLIPEDLLYEWTSRFLLSQSKVTAVTG
jgi:hypothetical protein